MVDLVSVTRVDANWNALVGTAKVGAVTYVVKANPNDSGFLDFDLTADGGAATNGHITVKHGYNPAHVTLLNGTGGAKSNYWYEVTTGKGGSIVIMDSKPTDGVSKLGKKGHYAWGGVPKAWQSAVRYILEQTYANSI